MVTKLDEAGGEIRGAPRGKVRLQVKRLDARGRGARVLGGERIGRAAGGGSRGGEGSVAPPLEEFGELTFERGVRHLGVARATLHCVRR